MELSPMPTDLRLSTATVRVVCRQCRQEFSSEYIDFGGQRTTATVCDSCYAELERAKNAPPPRRTEEERLAERLAQHIPPKFRRYDPKLYPAASLPSLRAVLAWNPEGNGQGLILMGETGKGKTWAMFRNLDHQVRAGKRVAVLDCPQFGPMVQAWFGPGGDPAAGNAVIDGYCRAEVLYIDDLGKEPLTERVQREYFRILDARDKACLPTILTTNLNGQDLIESHHSEHVGVAVVRRLRDNAPRTIHFPPPPEAR